MLEMSIWGLFAHASMLVKAIMISLVMISIISWTMIFQRMRVFRRAQVQLHAFEEQFWSGADLNRLYEILTSRENKASGMAKIFIDGFREYMRLRQQTTPLDADVIMAAAERSMRIAVNKESDQLQAQLSFLATVGSVSPYIGLFGTVWGIMHAFMALGTAQQATLAMVAPGIAEALIATAMGLFAAIPAVVAYNRYSQFLEKVLARYDTFQEEFSNILYRQAHLKAAKNHA